MKTQSLSILMGIILVVFAGCTKYPPSSDRLLEDLAVITQYDTKIDFNTYKTYAVADAIIKITSKDTTEIKDATAQAVLAEIDKNMQARGFSKYSGPGKPDFGIQVIYYENTYVYTYYYDYWGFPYYDWYYPYSPVYYSSYSTGMANIELVDLKVPDSDTKKLYLRWNAYIRGLITGSHSTADITGSVDQAFKQTPQLKTTAE